MFVKAFPKDDNNKKPRNQAGETSKSSSSSKTLKNKERTPKKTRKEEKKVKGSTSIESIAFDLRPLSREPGVKHELFLEPSRNLRPSEKPLC